MGRGLSVGLGSIGAFLHSRGFEVGIYNADIILDTKILSKLTEHKAFGWRGDMMRHQIFVESFESGFDFILLRARGPSE